MTHPIPEEIVEKIRFSIDLVEVVSDYIKLQKRGRNFVGLCPFHQEQSPSFTVAPEKQLYYCFGCGSGGNVFTFIMKVENLTFAEAVRFLAQRAGISIPEPPATGAQRKARHRKEQLYELNQLAADFYHRVLCQSPAGEAALKYLYSRGVDDRSVDQFELGFAPDRWDALLTFTLKKGYSEEILRQGGLAVSGRSSSPIDRFRNRLMFPIRDIQGRVIGFGGRLLGEGEPKYLNTPETALFNKSRCLYGLDLARREIREKRQAVIVEGYMDVIAAHQHGLSNVVASLGTALTEHQAYLLRTQAEDAVIAYDADTAGAMATWRGLGILRKAGCRVRVARLPEGTDPDDFIRRYGVRQFEEEVLTRAMPLVDYQLDRIKQSYNLANVEDRLRYSREAVKTLASIDNEVERREYLKKIAEEISISEEALNIELRKHIRRQRRSKRKLPGEEREVALEDTVRSSAALAAERELLSLMVTNPALVEPVSSSIAPEDFSDPRFARLAEVIFSCRAAGERVDPSKLISYFSEEGMHKLITYLSLREETAPEHQEKVLVDCVQKIKMDRLVQRRRAVEREIASLEKEPSEKSERRRTLLQKWWQIKLSENELYRSRERGD